ncbi:hypothetical protein V6N13_057835 [Hibiscus sabdariffa]
MASQKLTGTTTRKTNPVKKSATQDPIITRQALRPRGMPSDSADESLESISMIDAYRGVETEYNRVLVDTILSISKETQIDFSVKEVFNDDFSQNGALGSCKDDNFSESDPWRESLGLKPETVAWVALGKTTVVKFFPSSSTWMIAAGNKFGDISFWNIDCETEDGVYVYRTHSDPISGILIQQNSLSKIYSCGLDRFVRLMDAEKEVFDLVHSCDDAIHYLSQQPSDLASLYFAGGDGGLKVLDTRTGKSSRNWILHKDKINTISFNSHNSNIMATGSTDGTACIWDLRSRSSRRHETLKTLSQGEAVHSAYFSPSGSSLATIRYLGWDDSYIFIGNMKRGVDVISSARSRPVATLPSPKGYAIPYRFDTHPYEVGMLAAANNAGQVSLWTP